MLDRTPDEMAREYDRLGYLSPVDIVTPEEAAAVRADMERAEAEIGPLHYRPKMHTILPSVWSLVSHPRLLDVVEAILGPDVLLYNAEFIIKEPHTASFVSWHQDLTYWGLSHDDQVSLWLALSPATAESGCMRMIPGSHTKGVWEHDTTRDPNNVLFQGQTVHGVDEAEAVMCPLAPGQASFHHGWTLHASMPNVSDDRRIGLNAQFIAPHVRQTKHDRDTVVLVRGVDEHQHYGSDRPAEGYLEPRAVAHLDELERIHKESAGAT